MTRFDGYYDNTGRWQRTKFCFRHCGDRCTCMPPLGVFYNPVYDKSKAKDPGQDANDSPVEET